MGFLPQAITWGLLGGFGREFCPPLPGSSWEISIAAGPGAERQ